MNVDLEEHAAMVALGWRPEEGDIVMAFQIPERGKFTYKEGSWAECRVIRVHDDCVEVIRIWDNKRTGQRWHRHFNHVTPVS